MIIEKLKQYCLLMRLHKPIGILLLLWPTLWALWIAAHGFPPLKILLVFIAGVILIRSAGCAINDFADRDFDKHVTRTQQRPLTCGKISSREALSVFAIVSLCAFGLVLLLDQLTILLSLVAIIVIIVYPFMKRVTHYPQFILGIAYAFGVPMAFSAVLGFLPLVTLIIFAAAYCWIVAFDTMYAMTDREDDLKIGVKSTAIAFGSADRLIIGILQSIFIVLMIIIGITTYCGIFYYLGLLTAAGFIIYQHYLIHTRDPQQCFNAFLNNNWVGLSIFVGILFNYL